MPRPRCRVPLLVLAALAAGSYAFGQTMAPSTTTFIVRADPKWAKPIDEVLARLARPISDDGDTPKLQFTPRVEVVADRGDTLEAIALRHGFFAGRATSLKVKRKGHHLARTIAPGALGEGDVVVMKKVPSWTDVVTTADVDRSILVGEIAKALECPDAPDACLPRNGVFVVGGSAKAPATSTVPPPGRDLQRERPETLRDTEALARLWAAEASRRAEESRHAAESHVSRLHAPGFPARTDALGEVLRPEAMVAPTAAPPPVAVAAALPLSDDAGPAPVAPKQWPYDAGLVAALLAAKPQDIRHDAVIGVADGGLADAAGLPLPSPVYITAREENTTDGLDDDENKSVDDVFGGGVSDEQLSRRSGDVGICGDDPLPLGVWTPDQRLLASHGSIVASIAAALRMGSDPSGTERRLLPRLAFYRLLKTACGPEADARLRVLPMALMKAVQYLNLRDADVINASYTIENAEDAGLKSALETMLANGEKILVLPAGNDAPGDLDKAHPSPQCLANKDHADRRTANRVLVVGSATRELRRAAYSNFGDRTVRYYAPGEPEGALDVGGADASAADPSTSYAAPYAALAGGILRSFGVDQALHIKERLSAATWPIFDQAGQPQSEIGVIDLVKVAAVRHHTVEVVEPDSDGQMVRRTYAGRLELEPGGKLALCNMGYVESAVHAIRLSDPKKDADRTIRIHKRNDWDGDRLRVVERTCRPSGILTLHTLDGRVETFDWSNVTHVLLRWFTKN